MTTLSQSGPRSDDSKGLLHIPQSFSITGASPSDCLVSCRGHSLPGSLTLVQRCSWCILLPQPTGLSQTEENEIKLRSLIRTDWILIEKMIGDESTLINWFLEKRMPTRGGKNLSYYFLTLKKFLANKDIPFSPDLNYYFLFSKSCFINAIWEQMKTCNRSWWTNRRLPEQLPWMRTMTLVFMKLTLENCSFG